MKTKPTEALKIIDENWDKGGTLYNLKIADMIACNVAFKEGQSNPKIKQLEWKKFGKGEDLISKVLLGDYIISDNCSTYKLFINGVREGHSFFNINDAKQFAQDDFEERMKKCLIIE